MSSRVGATPRGVQTQDAQERAKRAMAERLPYYASAASTQLQKQEIQPYSRPARHVLRELLDQHSCDSQRANASSSVHADFEAEEEEVALLGLRVNLADQTAFPQSVEMHSQVVNMVAELWNCPKPEDFSEVGCFAGTGTAGSTEACLLAGLALKFRWRKWYKAQVPDATAASVRATLPNLVISTQFHAAWEKFFRFMDVEPRFITPRIADFTLDAARVAEAVDDKTIGVVCIMGNHYGGQYDRAWEVNEVLERVNAEKGLQVGIHVDAASGGFVAPFQTKALQDKPWDFRLKNVLSISSSGHKFGGSVCGTGWLVWRQRQDLAEHVALSMSHLGGMEESYTLNFSRPATGTYVQLYKFLRLGREGYQGLCDNMLDTARYLRKQIQAIEHAPSGKPLFRMLDNGEACLPVVAAQLDPELGLGYNDLDLQQAISMHHWLVSAYRMSFTDPFTDEAKPLFSDASEEGTMFRIVVKASLTRPLAKSLLESLRQAVEFLDGHGKGFKKSSGKDLRSASIAGRTSHAAC